ncbi:hypothetical protein [Methanobrevibacter arboriphilus]|uniref:Uncharacterized protein n=1 Tax=Methanobrevibacter arboriphilus TaxID=39441 RepID=A0ACA8R2G6_METAZ|nr:hypothetical protein [Methanobrevibacter arboriphilus]BBL61484.1 hypothetical protein MarbSA_05240 [Methanobrevibacter arboriphilus]
MIIWTIFNKLKVFLLIVYKKLKIPIKAFSYKLKIRRIIKRRKSKKKPEKER